MRIILHTIQTYVNIFFAERVNLVQQGMQPGIES
jgi:hypothetical protein